MTGVINLFIPRDSSGEPMTGPVPRGQRAVARKIPSINVLTYFDALADRNLTNAIHQVPKPKQYNARIAPRGWSLRPLAAPSGETTTLMPVSGFTCPGCHRTKFRTRKGLAWHVTNALDCGTRIEG